jgi:hypothetical protein
MIAPPASVRVWLAAGRTDMRKGIDWRMPERTWRPERAG